MSKVSGSTYPDVVGGNPNYIKPGGVNPWVGPFDYSNSEAAPEDPSARSGAVLEMLPFWGPINICIAGTNGLRDYAEEIIPREPREDDAAYRRRIFHATLPPFLQRLASQAAGTILRRGIHLEGGDEEYWRNWSEDVCGDGTSLNEFCRKTLVDSLLFGHSSVLVDFSGEDPPTTLAEELRQDRKPYLVSVPCQQIRGWRTVGNRSTAPLTMVRYSERVSVPDGEFGEKLYEQIRVLTPGRYMVYRYQDEDRKTNKKAGLYVAEGGTTSIDEVPLATVYSNRIATLVSKPPMVEVAELNIAYSQRFCDYHHSIHVGAQPILCLKGFDPENDTELGLSINTAVLLPPDGDGFYIEPTSAVYESQLKCLQTLEEQIRSLGVSVLAKQNVTNAAAEAKRLDRIDTDSIMALVSEDLARTVADILRIAGKYANVEPPTSVTIPQDFTNRLLDGNQITAMLQLQMQNQISQELLLKILQEGEVIPPYVEIDDEIALTKEAVQSDFDLQLEQAEAMGSLETEQSDAGGVDTGNAAEGSQTGSQTLATPLRPGKHSD